MDIDKIMGNWADAGAFSGVFSVCDAQGIRFEASRGFRNRAEELPNNPDTAFGIASGTKLFTGLAVCKLIDAKKLSLEDRLWDVLPYDLGKIDKRVTISQLLTHTSGIGDYLDEEADDDAGMAQALYDRYPVQLWERLEYYLQMITPLPQKFEPGARFGYSNAGYIMLGLAIEAAGGKPFQQFVAEALIAPLGLCHTGFYRSDALPANTAQGYIEDETGGWRSNVFSLPVIGGSDGGLYTCAQDLDTLWRGVFGGRVLSEETLRAFSKAQVARNKTGGSYGLGVYRYDSGENTAYYAVGGDFGIDFFTACLPGRGITASALGNTELSTYPLLDALLSEL